tara:strand:+ start:104 stop:277 length:174 start_codon:yes stop_codon:yes gene_type:complete
MNKKDKLIKTIVVVVGSLSVKVDEDKLRAYSNQKLIQILADNTSKSYDEINNIFKQY